MSQAAAMTLTASYTDRLLVGSVDRSAVKAAISEAADASAAALSPAFLRLSRYLAEGAASVHHLGKATSASIVVSARLTAEAAADVSRETAAAISTAVTRHSDARRGKAEAAARSLALAGADPLPLQHTAYEKLAAHYEAIRATARAGVRDALLATPEFRAPPEQAQASVIAQMSAVTAHSQATVEEQSLREAEATAGEPMMVWRNQGGFARFARLEATLNADRDRAIAAANAAPGVVRRPVQEATATMRLFLSAFRARISSAAKATISVSGLVLGAVSQRAKRLHRFVGENSIKLHIGATELLSNVAQNRYARVTCGVAVVGVAATWFGHATGMPHFEIYAQAAQHLGGDISTAISQVSAHALDAVKGVATAAAQLATPEAGSHSGFLMGLPDVPMGSIAKATANHDVGHHVASHLHATASVPLPKPMVARINPAHAVSLHTPTGGPSSSDIANVDPSMKHIPITALENAEFERIRPLSKVDWGNTSHFDQMRAREAVVRAAHRLSAVMGKGVVLPSAGMTPAPIASAVLHVGPAHA